MLEKCLYSLSASFFLIGCSVELEAPVTSDQHEGLADEECRASSGDWLDGPAPWEESDSMREWRDMTLLDEASGALLEQDMWHQGLRAGDRAEFKLEHMESGITVWIRGLRAAGAPSCQDGEVTGPGLIDLLSCDHDPEAPRDCSKVWLWSDVELVEPDMSIVYWDGSEERELACPYLFLNEDELWCGRDGNRSGSVFSVGTVPRCDGPGMTITSDENSELGDVLCGGLGVEVSYRVLGSTS